MDEELIAKARGEADGCLRWFQTPSNGATTASHAARQDREQRYGLATAQLMRSGQMMPLKRKYNPYR